MGECTQCAIGGGWTKGFCCLHKNYCLFWLYVSLIITGNRLWWWWKWGCWKKVKNVDTLLKRNYFHFLMAFTSAGALRLNSSIYDHLIYECTFLLPTHLCAVFPVSQFRYQPPVFLPLLFVFCSFCCLCTNMSACLPGSQQVRGLYLITARLNSLRQWRLIWRGGPGLSLPDPVPNTITPLFRYPAVFYNFAIFQCQGQAFWRVFIEFPAGPCCRGHFFPSSLQCHHTFSMKHCSFCIFLFSIFRTMFHCYHHDFNELKPYAEYAGKPPAYLIV